MTQVHAIFCRELDELMLESGRTIKVPPQIARTVSPRFLDTRFVRSWAVMCNLIPAGGEVSVLQAA